MNWSKLALARFFERPASLFASYWQSGDFGSDERHAFARIQLESETRSGVQTLAAVLLVPYLLTALCFRELGLSQESLYASLALSALCVHVYVSSRAVHDIDALYLLATVLMVVSGTILVLLAHRAGQLDRVVFASVGLLFMVIPLVPWGVREGSIVASVIYGLFTLSTLSVSERFASTNLWSFQLFMAASALVSITVVGRMAMLRKRDIALRFDLMSARSELEALSLQDSLTGVWNRRFLEAEFPEWSQCDAHKDGRAYFTIIDIDAFKQLNDGFGHTYGDQVLVWIAKALKHAVGSGGFVARVGGDEFACFFVADDASRQIEFAAETLNQTFRAEREPDRSVPTFCAGIVRLPSDRPCELAEIYKAADNALYEAKELRSENPGRTTIVTLKLDAPPAEPSA